MAMFLFKLYMSYFYSFLSAIIAAVAINLLTTANLETTELSIPDSIVYGATVSLIASAIGFFIVSWRLEEAKTKWLLKNAPPSQDEINNVLREQLMHLWIGFVLGVMGLIYFFVLIISKKWFPLA